ncbi:MAG: hypothetical protein ACP5UU_05650, partial [Thermoprotei archaeon]
MVAAFDRNSFAVIALASIYLNQVLGLIYRDGIPWCCQQPLGDQRHDVRDEPDRRLVKHAHPVGEHALGIQSFGGSSGIRFSGVERAVTESLVKLEREHGLSLKDVDALQEEVMRWVYRYESQVRGH